MRILIISDSHGRTDNIELIKKQIGKIDLILHCGDGTSDFDYIRSLLGAPVTGVTGNCDMFSQERTSVNLNIEGKIIHNEHGNPNQFLPDTYLLEYAAANGFEFLLY